MQHNEYMIRVSCIFTILVQVALLGVEFNCYPLKYVKHLQRRISLTHQQRWRHPFVRRSLSPRCVAVQNLPEDCCLTPSSGTRTAGGKTVPLY